MEEKLYNETGNRRKNIRNKITAEDSFNTKSQDFRSQLLKSSELYQVVFASLIENIHRFLNYLTI